jgi:phospholipase D1/2
MDSREELVVASYNVHGCVGLDRSMDPHRVAAVIAELDASIVGLQEVDARPSDSEGLGQLEALARDAGFTWTDGPTMERPDGRYGNALLTKIPPREIRHIDLSMPEREPRGAIDAEFEYGDTRIRVVVAHLGLRPWERRAQCDRLLRNIGPDGSYDLSLLLGDFNEWWAAGPLLRRLHRAFGRTRGVRSFPARAPLFSLDRIWVKPARAVREIRAHRSALARQASDHLPVTARIELAPKDSPTQRTS